MVDLDLALVARVRRGDRAAFRLLVERWQTMVFGLHLRMTGSRSLAEELAQETFLRAYQRLGDFAGDSRFSTWLYSIARNLCLDHLKRKRPIEVDEAVDPPSPAATPEESVRSSQAAAVMQAHLLALPEAQREAFVLRHVEGLEYEEIAERCRITVTNAKVRVHRARETLSQRMQGDDDGT